MSPERWARIQELFHQATDLPEALRPAFLSQHCRDDPSLVAEVIALLDADARSANPVDQPVAAVAHELLRAVPTGSANHRFGPYRISRVLGEGGMGIVYLGVRDDLDTKVAIKILRDAWLSPARRERFASEERLLAQLSHPAIAALHDAGSLPDGTPWFVMEYVEGVPITDYCQAQHCSLRERLRLFRSVCDAVAHAHRHAIVHRDLKPSNVLVTTDRRVKLLDFGIAKQIETLDDVTTTRTGLRMMTPAYAAPEQFRGTGIGLYTDIYSLGVLLYELLAGRLPFDLTDKNPAEAAALVAAGDAPKPSVVAWLRALPGDRIGSRSSWADLDVLCQKAMHPDPERRYPSVEALIRDIDHFLDGEPLEARPDDVAYQVIKFASRNRRAVVIGAIGLLAAVILVAFYTVRLATARDNAVANAARAARIQGFTMRLFEGGDEAAGPADSLRVVTLLDRGLQDARTLEADPATQAELYLTLGSIHQKLGNLERADTLLTKAVAKRRALLGNDHQDVAAALVELGSLQSARAQFPAAAATIREAIAIADRTLPPTHPTRAKAFAVLGQVFELRGTYDSAITTLDRAVALYAVDSTNADFVQTLGELANTHFYAGHYAVADSLFHRVLTMSKALYGNRHPHVGDDLINLGAVQFEQDHFAAAERYYREGLEIIQGFYGDLNPETASAETMLSRALVNLERYDEAAALVQKALIVTEKVYGPIHPRVASAVNEVGRIALKQKRYDDARAAFERMTAIYREVYHDKHYQIGVAMSNLSGVYQAEGRFDDAIRLLRDVLRRYTEVLEPDHQLVGIANIRLGRNLLGAKQVAEAEKASLLGYQILSKQASPPRSWLDNARTDLAAAYKALGRPSEARRFEAEVNARKP